MCCPSPSLSLVTTLSIQWEPQAVAVAFIYLAAKLSKYDIQSKYGSKSRSWWRQFVGTLDSHDLDCKRRGGKSYDMACTIG